MVLWSEIRMGQYKETKTSGNAHPTLESILRAVQTQAILFLEINVGNGRIRHTTTLKLNDEYLDPLKIIKRFKFRVVICRIRLFPTSNSKIKLLGYDSYRMNYP